MLRSNFCPNKIFKSPEKCLRTFNILFGQKLKLSIEHQSYSKSTKIDAFEQKTLICHSPNNYHHRKGITIITPYISLVCQSLLNNFIIKIKHSNKNFFYLRATYFWNIIIIILKIQTRYMFKIQTKYILKPKPNIFFHFMTTSTYAQYCLQSSDSANHLNIITRYFI